MKPEKQTSIKNSIATRLLKIVFSLYLIIAMGITAGHMIMEYRYQKSNIFQDLKDIQKTFERGIALDLWQMNQKSLHSTVEGILEIPAIVGVKIKNFQEQIIAIGGIISLGESIGHVGQHVHMLGLSQEESLIHDIKKEYRFELFEHLFPITYKYKEEEKHLGEVTIFSNSSVVFRRVKLGFFLLIINAVLKTAALWIIFLWFSNRLLRKPLEALASDTKKITLDNLDLFRIKITTSGQNELTTIENSFNLMIDNLHQSIEKQKKAEIEKELLQEKLRQSQKMEAIGTLAGGIAHDFNNILSIILGYSDLLKTDITLDTSSNDRLDGIIKAGNRAKELVSQILAFSRQSKKEFIPIQPDIVVREALKMLRASIPSTITIDSNISKCGSIIGDPGQLHQIMMNLCTNAYHAMRETGGFVKNFT